MEISLFESEISANPKNSQTSESKAKPPAPQKSLERPDRDIGPAVGSAVSEQGQESDASETKKPSLEGALAASSALSVDQVSILPKVIVQERAEYPESAKQARVEGAVKLSVIIDTLGRVQSAEVLEGPGFGLDETAQRALMKFKFSPAEKDGSKVPVKIIYVYRFRLESR